MARIAGIDLPRNKRGVIGLTYIYGIGPSTAKKLLDDVGIDHNTKVGEWSNDQVQSIAIKIQDDVKVEGELRSEVQLSIKRLMDIACFRGIRHRKGLPVRGQRTKTNARTRKGKRKTVANKKKATK
ncbi:MAG: 30S ribosomal protein S13 [Saprospiraceae bacterium]|jgi:small subunit ribosomal protein S13|nr:30S ribosomal protein S13 [Saprospiraceae bacterium]MBK9992977.1 30S ribosomal protein S13 [Saprospiraceae bacterium]